MSQEIQLVNANLPAQPALAPQVLAPAGPPDTTPLMRIHRLLRGRYKLAIFLAAIGAAVGTAAGIMLPKPAYESAGIVRIRPLIPTPNDVDKVMPLSAQYMADVMVQLHTDRVIRQAMSSGEWKQKRPYAGLYPPPEAVIEFSKNLTVKQMPGAPEMIQIIYSDTRPDSKDVAQIAVQQVILAYTELFAKEDAKEVSGKIDYLQQQKNDLEMGIISDRRNIANIAKEFGDDVQAIVTARTQNLLLAERDLKDAREMLRTAQQQIKHAQEGKPGQAYLPEDIARVDPLMAAKLNNRTELELKLRDLQQQGFLEKNQQVRELKSMLGLRQQDIEQYASEYNAKYFIKSRPDGSAPTAVPKDLTTLQDAVSHYQDQYNTELEAIKGLTARHRQIDEFNESISHKKVEIDALQKTIEQLNFQKDTSGTMTVVSNGELPTPAADRRPVFAALGFLGGGALPVGLLLLVGLANPRYRFSDETGSDLTGLNLLGILPDLPDRLSDPEQASIAAHCVHQIRTMLQISGSPEERRVFAITSAAPGDGKTSLTLALGLSYAACGTRTLLIDCDLVGAGLTARMNVNAPEGVLEAIANRSLLEFVRSTDVADVSILPVGSAQTLHASTLSPAALRRLVDEAKKQFDTILVDTGPILGSIEASLVCAAADAVVLTVARGQQRPLVEKAISHLMGIGAKLAGIVFNRAQAADFDRSISGVSLRSVAAGTGHNGNDGPKFGTLGRTVQSRATSELNDD